MSTFTTTWCRRQPPHLGWDPRLDRVTGTLTVADDVVRFESSELRWETRHVASVSFGIDPEFRPNDWIVLELEDSDGAARTTYLRDGGWFGYRAVFSMRRMQRELAAFRSRCGEVGVDTKAHLGAIGIPGDDPISQWFQSAVGRVIVTAVCVAVAVLIAALLVTNTR